MGASELWYSDEALYTNLHKGNSAAVKNSRRLEHVNEGVRTQSRTAEQMMYGLRCERWACVQVWWRDCSTWHTKIICFESFHSFPQEHSVTNHPWTNINSNQTLKTLHNFSPPLILVALSAYHSNGRNKGMSRIYQISHPMPWVIPRCCPNPGALACCYWWVCEWSLCQ